MSSYDFRTAIERIRDNHQICGIDKWGFNIYRCSYLSQGRWEKFISLLKEDTKEYLENDQDLWETLEWKIIENEEALSGKGWKETREFHDAWVLEELRKKAENGNELELPDYMSESEKLEARVDTQPHFEFFIFADEVSINSVVDGDANNKRGAPGGYYITLVQSGLVTHRGEWDEDWDEDAGEERPEIDEGNPEHMKALLRNFKAWELVNLYNAILQGDWHEGFEKVETGITFIR